MCPGELSQEKMSGTVCLGSRNRGSNCPRGEYSDTLCHHHVVDTIAFKAKKQCQ